MGVGDSKDVNVVPDDGLPSVELTRRFLALSDHYGSQEAAVGVVGRGRRAGAPGLPDCDDWTVWDAGQMRAVAECLEDDAVSTSGGSAPRRW